MKILWNFHTWLDQEKIHEKSFIIKQYPMYMVSFWKIVLYLFFILILFFFMYFQNILFWNKWGTFSNIIYGILILYWFYAHWNFIFYYAKNFQDYYDLTNIHILKKQDIIFDKALSSSLFLLLLNFILSIISLIYWYTHNPWFFNLFSFIFLNVMLIILQWLIIKKALIDFEMDFTVVDGLSAKIDKISQSWFFKINSSAAKFNLISSIDWDSSWIVRSYLGYGFIEIVTMSDRPNLTIRYVKNPSFIVDLIDRAQTQIKIKSWNNEIIKDYNKDKKR